MESLESRTVRGRDRERENRQKTLFQNNALTQCTLQCVFNAHFLYKSFGGLTEVLSYFNPLKERLHKLQNIFLMEYLSLRHPSVPTDSVLGLTDRSLPTRSSASSADSADVELVSQQQPMTTLTQCYVTSTQRTHSDTDTQRKVIQITQIDAKRYYIPNSQNHD